MAEIDDAVRDRLYAVPLKDFVRERDRIVKELRDAGERDVAAAVKSLRRPPPPVWAINRLVRDDPEIIQRVLDAGAEVVEAQRRATRGRGTELREASRALHEAIADAASSVPEEHRRPVQETLLAATTDDEARDLLRRGALQETLTPAGFGFTAAPASARTSRDDDRDRKALEDEAKARRKAVREAEQETERLSREVTAARKQAEVAMEKARDLESLAQRADERLRASEARLDERRADLGNLEEQLGEYDDGS